jgi:BirA family biotin operon repressor/biotin-[acetyl-CoA-carboxylase] ligase
MAYPQTDIIDVSRLLASGRVRSVDYRASVASTQDVAAALAEQGGETWPALVIAEEQTAGRGRGTNRWWTGGGSLALSLVFDPRAWGLDAKPAPARSLAAAVALIEVLAPRLPGRTVGLCWPNDVFVERRKIAGILVDVLPSGLHVLGVGLNVNNSVSAAPAELRDRATSLCELTGQRHDRTELVIELIEQVERALRQLAAAPDEMGARFDRLCLQTGRQITVDQGGQRTTGRCAGIAPDGALLLETFAGRQTIYAGVLVKP